MTVEQLLDLPAARIEEMSDAELTAHLRPFFPATRAAGVIEKQLEAAESDPELEAAIAALRAEKAKGAVTLKFRVR